MGDEGRVVLISSHEYGWVDAHEWELPGIRRISEYRDHLGMVLEVEMDGPIAGWDTLHDLLRLYHPRLDAPRHFVVMIARSNAVNGVVTLECRPADVEHRTWSQDSDRRA